VLTMFLELIQGYYAYFFLVVLFTIGLYGMMMKRNLMKKVLGMSIVQSVVILFWIVSAYKEGGTVTVLDERLGVENPDLYLNPLPHTLMLTAIVVAVVTLGVSLALIINIYRNHKTIDEAELLEQMK
jgi:multicomponent Na+:H+ antiporter subunit C